MRRATRSSRARATLAEARRGAGLADAALVAVPVGNDAATVGLFERFDVHADPTLLVFDPHGELTFRVDGFADALVVEQAAVAAQGTRLVG